MLAEYKVVSLDHLISGSPPAQYLTDPAIVRALEMVRYKPLLRSWRQTRDDRLFLLNDDYNRKLADAYWDMAGQSHVIAPCGELQFDHIWCLGRDALRVDIDNGVVFTGHCINWGEDYFKWWIQNSEVGFNRWLTADSFSADFGDAKIQDDNIIMMKSPGYDIFGHWLLDFVPQMSLNAFMDSSDKKKYVFDATSDWIEVLLKATGIENYECYQHSLTEHFNLRMPTGVKNGFALSQPINGIAWNRLRAYFNHQNCLREPAEQSKLFISRKNWRGQRGLSNYEDIEALMASLGFSIFYPEKFSLTEQAHIISDARIVVGEDGSALHSLMLTNPGAILGVLMLPDRFNLWHAGICHTMGHRLAYHEICDNDGSRDAIASFVEKLLSQA